MKRTRLTLSLVVMLCGSAVLTIEGSGQIGQQGQLPPLRQSTYTPSQADSDNYRGKPCNDPWINIAYRVTDNTSPPGTANVGACDIQRYNRGRWNSFEDLRQMIYAARLIYQINRVSEALFPTNDPGRYRLATYYNGQLVGAPLVGQDGASLVYDPYSLIGKGGAGVMAIVAAGGGNIVAAGGGNIVAAGGGNMKDLGSGIYLRTVAP